MSNRLREYMKSSKARLYALDGHLLAAQDEYVKGLYLKMLCVVIRYQHEVQEEQSLLLERILNGAAAEGSVADYMRKSLDVEEEDLQHFIEAVGHTDIRFAFVLDSLVLVHAGHAAADDQHTLIAEIAEQLRMSASEIRYLSLLARSILEQAPEQYEAADEIRPQQLNPVALAACYTRGFVPVLVMENEESFVAAAAQKSLYSHEGDSSRDGYTVMNHRRIVLENVIIDTSIDRLRFESSEAVLLRNCEFIGSDSGLVFQYCKDVRLENCTFRDFTGRTIMLEDVKQVEIVSCAFSKCRYKHESESDWGEEVLGSVIYSKKQVNVQRCMIDSCEFKECGLSHSESHYSTYIISNCAHVVRNSKFTNCQSYYQQERGEDKMIGPEYGMRHTLFSPLIIQENNEIIASVKLV